MNNTVMTKLLFSIFVFTSSCFSFSQDKKECEVQIKQNLIDKIQDIEPKDLAPFYDTVNKRWGFINGKSQEVVVPGLFKNLETFAPTLNAYPDRMGKCPAHVKYENGTYSIYQPESQRLLPPSPVPRFDANKYVKDIPGFQVNENKEIIAVNAKFFAIASAGSDYGYLRIKKLFVFDDLYYGVVRNEDNTFSIYSEKGDVLNGFENMASFPFICNSYSDRKDLWIFAKIDADNFSFKSIKSGKIVNIEANSPACWDCVGRNFFGYQILNVDGAIGLFDLIKMKWKIKPSKENRFHSLHFSSNVEINKCETLKELKRNRKLCTLYLQTYENTIVDIEGNELLIK